MNKKGKIFKKQNFSHYGYQVGSKEQGMFAGLAIGLE